MAPIIKFALTSGGSAIATCQNLNSAVAGDSSDEKVLYITHNGTNAITGCGLFIQPYTGAAYTGSAGQDEDYDEIIGWGDTYYNSASAEWTGTQGGFQVTQDSGSTYSTLRTGEGTYTNPLTLSADATGDEAGVIDATTGEAIVQVRIFIPSTETTTGLRFIDFGLKYTYTS